MLAQIVHPMNKLNIPSIHQFVQRVILREDSEKCCHNNLQISDIVISQYTHIDGKGCKDKTNKSPL